MYITALSNVMVTQIVIIQCAQEISYGIQNFAQEISMNGIQNFKQEIWMNGIQNFNSNEYLSMTKWATCCWQHEVYMQYIYLDKKEHIVYAYKQHIVFHVLCI